MSIQPLTARQVEALKPQELLGQYKTHIIAQHAVSISGVAPSDDRVHVQPNLELLEAELMAKLKLAMVA